MLVPTRLLFGLAAAMTATHGIAAGFTDEAGRRSWDFEGVSLGARPPNWTVAKTGVGEGSVWTVVEDKAAPKGPKVLAQTAESPSAVFNLCIANETRFQDLEAKVSFKAIKGKIDQGGGVIWRCVDADNYYIARYNPLENNLRLYKVLAGKRIQLATKERLVAPANEWHSLSIAMTGERIQVRLNGRKELEASDAAFPAAGKVGLWTKADAQTYFDDFIVNDRKEKAP